MKGEFFENSDKIPNFHHIFKIFIEIDDFVLNIEVSVSFPNSLYDRLIVFDVIEFTNSSCVFYRKNHIKF